MTDEELRSVANLALKSLPQALEVISAHVIEIASEGAAALSDQSSRSLAWLQFGGSRQQPHELLFILRSDDPQWVAQEIIRHLRSNTSFVNNEINVQGSVSGVLVGTNTGVINRNYFGGDTYNQVQFYVLSESGRATGMSALIQEVPEPYKFLSPYGPRDQAIFKGRDNEIAQLLRIIHEQRLVVINGEASVGKTSLLAAGVVPRLIAENLLVIKIQEYANPTQVITQAIRAQEELSIPIPDDSTLPGLVKAITAATGGTLVLVFDQFELFFESSISADQREDFLAELASCLRSLPADLLRLIIVVRDEIKPKLWEYQEHLPELLRCQFQLMPLDREQAAIAIREPLRVIKSQVTFHDDVVERLLVPGLAELGSGGDSNFVHPPNLQVVCSWLYRKSTETDPPRVIDKELLKEAKGADGIFASYLEETLNKIEDERRLSSRMMEQMTRLEADKWVFPSQLHEMNPDVSVIDIEQTLETLVQAGLLVKRTVDRKYAFVSPTIAREILRLAGPEVEKRSQAEKEVERIWLSWLARNAFASSDQLRYLESFGTHLTPRAVRTMLLLRSSVERDESPIPWVDLLGNNEGRALIHQLEGLPLPDGVENSSEIVLTKAEELLALPSDSSNGGANRTYNAVGPISQNAVVHVDSAVRQTCALALTAIADDKSVALSRLDQALAASRRGKRRHAELRGVLADADSKIEEINRSLPKTDRPLIWMWRASRRVVRDRQRLIALTLGGAVGAGLSLAFLRGIVASIEPRLITPGIQFGMFFYYAFILAASLALGMALAKPLLLRQPTSGRQATSTLDPRISSLTSPLAVLLGGIFFGLAHMLVTIINGLTTNLRVAGMGFVAGLGLSLAISIGNRIQFSAFRWPLTIIVAAVFWALIQIVFNFTEDPGDAMSIVWNGWFYESRFRQQLWWQRMSAGYPNLPELFAAADALLVGACLAAGSSAGLSAANKYLNKQRRNSSLSSGVKS